MGRVAEGNQAFTAVFNAFVDEADHNDFQQQIADIVGPLVMPIPIYPAYGDTSTGSAPDWVFSGPVTTGITPSAIGGTNPPNWNSTGGINGQVLYVQIPWARAGYKIIDVSARVYGDGSAGDDYDGYIKLVSRALATNGAWTAVSTISATPWRTASAYATVTNAAVNHTMVSGSEYALEFRACRRGSPSALISQFCGLWATVQMGV